MKVAMTLDARIAPPPAQQTPHAPYWITSEAARAAVQPLRWAADATMVGVDTVLADDPWMTDRSGLRRRRPLLRIVLDSALRMPLDCKLVSTAQNDVVVFTVSHDEARVTRAAQSRRPRGSSRLQMPAASRSTKFSRNSAKKASSPCSPKPARASTPPFLPPASSIASISSSRRRSWAPTPSPPSSGMPSFVHMTEVEVERYGNDLGLCSLLLDPWPPAQNPEPISDPSSPIQ